MTSSLPTRLSAVPLLLGTLLVALCALGSPAQAHGDGDVATNTRGVQVETEGEGKRMRFVANLQYNRSGEAQNGSDIEFMRLGDREYALAGTLRGGCRSSTSPTRATRARWRRTTATISQGDIQVWKNDGRVLASYTADGTVGEAGAALAVRPRPRARGRRRRHRPRRPHRHRAARDR